MKLLFLLPALLSILASSCQSSDKKTESLVQDNHDDAQILDQPSVHGMLMVGDGPVYLSHLPMFHKPHDYQVLLQVELIKTGSDPTAFYAEDRQVTGEKVYTLVPEVFKLPELFTPLAAPVRKSFKASIFRGHFERGGVKILSNVTVVVKQVIYAKKFLAAPVPLPNLQYLIFGNEQELFAAHVVNQKPDFDHVVGVQITGGVLTDTQAQAIRAGSLLNLPGVANETEQAFKEGQDVTGGVTLGSGTLDITLKVLTDYYLETGDLEI